MTPIDAINFFDGQLRLVTHHYRGRSETVLIHVPTMRQFDIAGPDVVSRQLTEFEAMPGASPEGVLELYRGLTATADAA